MLAFLISSLATMAEPANGRQPIMFNFWLFDAKRFPQSSQPASYISVFCRNLTLPRKFDAFVPRVVFRQSVNDLWNRVQIGRRT
jgi:hypothetical protein